MVKNCERIKLELVGIINYWYGVGHNIDIIP